jgi:hypothetical protein
MEQQKCIHLSSDKADAPTAYAQARGLSGLVVAGVGFEPT